MCSFGNRTRTALWSTGSIMEWGITVLSLEHLHAAVQAKNPVRTEPPMRQRHWRSPEPLLSDSPDADLPILTYWLIFFFNIHKKIENC